MPFTTPWRQYKPGDLLYGLAQNRGRLAAAMGIKKGAVYTIDQYGIMTDPRAQTLAQNHLKYDPEFIAALQNSEKMWNLVDTDLNDNAVWTADRNNAINIAKRKCKAGLEYIVHRTRHHIHFCLDGLNLEQAANKNYDGSAGGVADTPGAWTGQWNKKARSITGAELRWVYRNRLDPKVQERIQFWKVAGSNWICCPPPWDDASQTKTIRQAWEGYKPRGNTYLKTAVAAVLAAYDKKIHWFFAHSTESTNALPKIRTALHAGEMDKLLALVCYYLNVNPVGKPLPPTPSGAGARLKPQSHLYRYLYTELTDGGIVA